MEHKGRTALVTGGTGGLGEVECEAQGRSVVVGLAEKMLVGTPGAGPAGSVGAGGLAGVFEWFAVKFS